MTNSWPGSHPNANNLEGGFHNGAHSKMMSPKWERAEKWLSTHFYFLFLHGLILYSHNSSEKDKGRPLRASAPPSQPVTP